MELNDIWTTVINDIPMLKKQMNKILMRLP
jgi:uncharacterized protein with HEPN domain